MRAESAISTRRYDKIEAAEAGATSGNRHCSRRHLLGMRERMEQIGGSLATVDQPGGREIVLHFANGEPARIDTCSSMAYTQITEYICHEWIPCTVPCR